MAGWPPPKQNAMQPPQQANEYHARKSRRGKRYGSDLLRASQAHPLQMHPNALQYAVLFRKTSGKSVESVVKRIPQAHARLRKPTQAKTTDGHFPIEPKA